MAQRITGENCRIPRSFYYILQRIDIGGGRNRIVDRLIDRVHIGHELGGLDRGRIGDVDHVLVAHLE